MHDKVTEANVYNSLAGVKDADLLKEIKRLARKNESEIKKFLMSNENIELQLEFLKKRVTRKRSG